MVEASGNTLEEGEDNRNSTEYKFVFKSYSGVVARTTDLVALMSSMFKMRTGDRMWLGQGQWVFLVIRPNPVLPFALEPHIQKWVIFVRRRPCVCDTFRFESPPPLWKKDRIWRRLPPPPSCRLRQLNFPSVKNNAGQKQYSPCFLRRRRRPKAWRRLHKNTAYAHLWTFSRPFC